MAKQSKAVHFSDGEKVICGTKSDMIATDGMPVTCGRCIALLRETKPKEPVDPTAIHFSDGEKVICGAEGSQAITDQQRVTCARCNEILTKKAAGSGDPLVACRVKNQDLNDGVDFAFFYRAPGQKVGKSYHLINNAPHNLPRSVIEHLKTIAYPYKRYVPDQEAGRAMQIAGKYNRFTVTEL